MRFFMTELPILPVSAEAPITATERGLKMRFICRRISSRGSRSTSGCGSPMRMRTSAATAPFASAKTGLRSTSTISGMSVTSLPTRSIKLASACLFAGSAPRAPRSTSAALMSSSILSASSPETGASRKVTSFNTSTRTPPRPNAITLPKVGSVTAPTMTSWPPPTSCCTWMPSIFASGL
jgi:hypothetical protein